MSGDEQSGPPGEARALIGATWEALAEERGRASRARRKAEARIAELEQALAAAREGTEDDSDGAELTEQLKRQRDELRAQVRAGEQALREAETQRERLATRLRRRERDQARARQLAQELAQERDARSVAQGERDELAALLERERAALRGLQASHQEPGRQPPPEPAGNPQKDARRAQARADERERHLRTRAAEKLGWVVEEKRGVEQALARAIAAKERAELVAQIQTRRNEVSAEARNVVLQLKREREALRKELSDSTRELTNRVEILTGDRDEHKRRAEQTGEQLSQRMAEIKAMRDEMLKARQALKHEDERKREHDDLRKELADSVQALSEHSSRIQALEAVNAQLTEIARRGAQAQQELTAVDRARLCVPVQADADPHPGKPQRAASPRRPALEPDGDRALKAVNAQLTEAARQDARARTELLAKVDELTEERDELARRARDEAGTRERLEQQVVELSRRARRAADEAAISRRR